MKIHREDTAVVFIDPQNEVLSEKGLAWPLVRESLQENIQDGKTVVVAPHRVFGPETNDLVLQLRKRKISKIILGGMLANMCVESHLRELLEQGFEVAVAKDATAAPKHPEWGYGYQAALQSWAYLANAVWTTAEAVKAMENAQQ